MDTSQFTLGRFFLRRIEKSKLNNAYGVLESGAIKFKTYQEYYDEIACLSHALGKLGMSRGDKFSLLGNTCFQWHLLDLAVVCSGACTVPIYPTYQADEIKFIFNHSDSKFLAIEDNDQVKKMLPVIKELSNLKVLIGIKKINPDLLKDLSGVKFVQFDDLFKNSNEEEASKSFKASIEATSPEDLASIIYTSGTTGEPKGAVIENFAICQMLTNIQKTLSAHFTHEDRTLTWLPLSHVFGRADSLLPIGLGWEMVFSRGLDKVVEDIAIVKPSIMLAVPRIFEKIYSKIHDQIKHGPAVKKKIFAWAESVSNAYFEKLEKDLSPSPLQFIQRQLAVKLVYSKVYQKFGGRLRFFVSGGAPLSPTIIKFLRNCNLTVLEGYGLTETVAPCCINPPTRTIPGTVGLPVGDVQFKIAEDGELLIKTKARFREYYKNPEETKKAIIDDWFYSGDIVTYDENGYLKITDRKKEILITSGGKNVAPQKLENMMKTQSLISQFVVVGEMKNFLTGIVGLEKEAILSTLPSLGIDTNSSIEDIAKHPEMKEAIMQQVNEVNKKLARFEAIKKIYIAPFEFSVESGLLTPSLKVKRKVAYEKFAKEIEEMYEAKV